MTDGDRYLSLALGLLSRAAKESDPRKRAGLEELAEICRNRAEQIRDNALTIEFELPPNKD